MGEVSHPKKPHVPPFFFLVEPRDGATRVHQSSACHIDLGCRGFHPTGGEECLGKCFMHAPAYAGQCGTGVGQVGSLALPVSPWGASRRRTH